jgi:hypothetical protein
MCSASRPFGPISVPQFAAAAAPVHAQRADVLPHATAAVVDLSCVPIFMNV